MHLTLVELFTMSKPIQISIPHPCHEDWNKMTPIERGRFCNNCQKAVIDFRAYSDTQLYNYLQQHKGVSICGRVYSSQLNRSIHIPHQPHSRLYLYFLGLSLILVFSSIPNNQIFAQKPVSVLTKKLDQQTQNKESKSHLVVTIKDETFRPVPNAIYTVTRYKQITTSGRTDSTGMFEITDPSPGVYLVNIQAWGLEFSRSLHYTAAYNNHFDIILDDLFGEDLGRIVIMPDASTTNTFITKPQK